MARLNPSLSALIVGYQVFPKPSFQQQLGDTAPSFTPEHVSPIVLHAAGLIQPVAGSMRAARHASMPVLVAFFRYL